ncbi:hypothetical protein H1R20_g15509, partial [Candolleomyces eurysporus]
MLCVNLDAAFMIPTTYLYVMGLLVGAHQGVGVTLLAVVDSLRTQDASIQLYPVLHILISVYV